MTCPDCGKELPTERGLKIHMARKHSVSANLPKEAQYPGGTEALVKRLEDLKKTLREEGFACSTSYTLMDADGSQEFVAGLTVRKS
jgi:hypothetical protein